MSLGNVHIILMILGQCERWTLTYRNSKDFRFSGASREMSVASCQWLLWLQRGKLHPFTVSLGQIIKFMAFAVIHNWNESFPEISVSWQLKNLALQAVQKSVSLIDVESKVNLWSPELLTDKMIRSGVKRSRLQQNRDNPSRIKIPTDRCLNCDQQLLASNNETDPSVGTGVVAFTSVVNNKKTQIFIQDAVQEIYSILHTKKLEKEGNSALCVDCCLVFAQLYGLLQAFESRRKSDGFLGTVLTEDIRCAFRHGNERDLYVHFSLT